MAALTIHNKDFEQALRACSKSGKPLGAQGGLVANLHSANSLFAYASWLAAKSRSDFALPLRVRKGLEGCEAAPALRAGAGAIAESRKARFLARSAKNAPKFRITKGILNRLLKAYFFVQSSR
jgi:hypothetical protein